MVSFGLLDRLVSRAVNAVWGGQVLIRPMAIAAGPYGDIGPDESRPEATVTGHFASDPKTADVRGSVIGADGRGNTAFDVASTVVLITADQYAGLGYEVRQADRVRLLDEPGQPWFEVVKAPHNQGADVQIILARFNGAAS